MAEPAQKLIDEVRGKQSRIGNKKTAHPNEIADLQVAAHLALAQSNVELAKAITALTDTAGKNNGTLKDAITTLANKIADLAKK
ncbi:hypothetical protein AB0I27_22840 [Streptomyces sp. NPDC050597]|uniref:hypothetical protein n=1 Tax=Streptomyces sp. NPDC050597 TaxID=3157212 RepID=UPI00343A4A39